MRKIKILFHVGFAKTATTWLQKQVFPRLDDCIYLGKLVDNSADTITGETMIAKDLYEINCHLWKPIYASNPYRAQNSEPLINEYVAFLTRELIQKLSGSDNYTSAIMSEEAILEYSQNTGELNHYLLYRILNKLKDSLSEFCEPKISILVTFREQASFLQSYYAYDYTHQKERFPDFGKFLDHGIKNHHDAVFGGLWYNEIYRNFKDLFTEEELIFVPYELLSEDPASFVEKTIGHLGSTNLVELAETLATKRENANRGAKGSNKLRELSFVSTVIGSLSMKYKSMVPERYLDSVKLKRDLFVKQFGGIDVKGEVEINNEQRKMIEDLYRDSNTRLSEMISMDLCRLGYAVNKGKVLNS